MTILCERASSAAASTVRTRRTDGGLGKRSNVTHLSDTNLNYIHVHTDSCLSFQQPFKSHASVFSGCEKLTSIFGQFAVNDLCSKVKPGNLYTDTVIMVKPLATESVFRFQMNSSLLIYIVIIFLISSCFLLLFFCC